MHHHVLRFFVIFLAILPSFASESRSEDMISYVKLGQEVPLFSVTTLDGRVISTKELKGKVVVLNFWATWCAPCRTEMPNLEKDVWAKHKGAGFEVIAIARRQTDQEISGFRKENRFTFPIASDPEGKIYGQFANAGIPRTYVLSPDGKIIYQSLGYDPGEFEKLKKVVARELSNLRKLP